MGGKPTQALERGRDQSHKWTKLRKSELHYNCDFFPYLKIFSIQALWRNRALTTGVPGGTIGAFNKYERIERTEWNCSKSPSRVFTWRERERERWHLRYNILIGNPWTNNNIIPDLYSLTEFSNNDQINDERSCKQRVLAGIVQDNGIVSSHEYLRRVLIHCTLGISNVRDILYDNLRKGGRGKENNIVSQLWVNKRLYQWYAWTNFQ